MPEIPIEQRVSRAVRDRLDDVLGWHVQLADASLTDDQLVRAVVNRYLKHRGLALIDVNE